ncbi:MAG: hypothetical protein WC975_15030 [Phycisphaerae bacterium]
MFTVKYSAIASILLIVGCVSSYRYPGAHGTITEYENYIRYNPHDGKVSRAREMILNKMPLDNKWEEINRYMAQFEDIEGARYDEENNRLIIWGPKTETGKSSGIPPLLLDDFAVALTVLQNGQNPGVSIGTISGHVPTQEDIERVMQTRKLPVEYIPESTFGTHLGSVLFEVDRCLKGLSHGEDNLNQQPVRSSVSGYLPVSRRLQRDNSWETGKPRPLGLWWFIPDESGLAFEGYTIKFVKYRMRVEYKALTNDPAVAAFGDHLNEHFDEFAREFPPFRELVRLHKLVQVARWYQESGFPTEDFQKSYRRLHIKTPETTRMIQTLANSETTPGPYPGSYYIRQSFLIGGVNLSPRNYYIPAPSVPSQNLSPGAVTHWQPSERNSVQFSGSPPRYGSLPATRISLPAFATPIFQARPYPTACGWTVGLNHRQFVAVSIPMVDRDERR